MSEYRQWSTKLHFGIKYYPEDVTQDLIEDLTIQYFFLEIRHEILNDTIYCPPETCFLLASYASQAKYGDFRGELDISVSNILPQRVYKQYSMSEESINENIVNLWKKLKSLFKEDAMIEYLKITQNLEMFGINYFPIKNQKQSSFLLGIFPMGLNVYKPENKLNAVINFPWSEIGNLTFKGRKFIIRPKDPQGAPFIFFTEDPKMNKRILNLGIGNHKLYIGRRKGDTMEMTELRENAENQRKKLNEQRSNLKEEVKKRELLEKTYNTKVFDLQSQLETMQIKLREYQDLIEQLHKQLAEKEQAKLELERQQSDLREMLLQLETAKNMEASEREKLEEEVEMKQLEVEKVLDAVRAKDLEAQRLQEEVERSRREQEELKQRQVEEEARRQAELEEIARLAAERPEVPELTKVNAQLESQLEVLQKQLEMTKNDNVETREDKIHMENLRDGTDKYKTLREIRKGNTVRRVDLFESM